MQKLFELNSVLRSNGEDCGNQVWLEYCYCTAYERLHLSTYTHQIYDRFKHLTGTETYTDSVWDRDVAGSSELNCCMTRVGRSLLALALKWRTCTSVTPCLVRWEDIATRRAGQITITMLALRQQQLTKSLRPQQSAGILLLSVDTVLTRHESTLTFPNGLYLRR